MVAIVICLIAIFNYSGLYYDIVGVMETKSAQSYSDIVENTTIQGQKLKAALTPGGEFFYDWGYGEGVYITFLSLLFMATIVLEGVDTSIMAKVTPPKLNDMFCNCGLLATLIGTLGRVFADSIITGKRRCWTPRTNYTCLLIRFHLPCTPNYSQRLA